MVSFLRDSGLMLEPQSGMKVDDVVGWAKYAERSGYGYLMRSDHLLPFGTRGIDSPECWATLGLIAASTKKIRFGPLVSPVGFRNPALLAKMACTVHAFSGGRLVLGMGAGWFKDEYDAMGIPFPGFRIRREQFREALTIVRSLVQQGNVDIDGQYFKVHTDCYPRPKGKLPLIIGGKNRGIVEMIGESADEWNTVGVPLETFKELKKVVDSRRRGRAVGISLMGNFIIGESNREVADRVRRANRDAGKTEDVEATKKRMVEGGFFCGTPSELVAQVNLRREAGVDRFYFQMLRPQETEMTDLLTETLKKGF